MDQPTIYSETIREGVGRSAFGVWRSAFGVWRHHVWERRLKTGAADLQKEQHGWRAEFFALPIYHPRNLQSLLALLIKDY
jgi:hypothetical protein